MKIINPIKSSFLCDFIFVADQIPFSNEELFKIDQDFLNYGRITLSPDITKL